MAGEPGAYRVRTTGSQSSGVLRSLALGNGLIVAPPDMHTIERGRSVRVIKLMEESASLPPV
jgi:molybdopterin molybdotransferase